MADPLSVCATKALDAATWPELAGSSRGPVPRHRASEAFTGAMSGRAAAACLCALTLLSCGVHNTHSFSPLLPAGGAARRGCVALRQVGHSAALAPLAHAAELWRCRSGRGAARARGLQGARATAAASQITASSDATGDAAESGGDPVRKQSWAKRRAGGLMQAASKGVVPLKYIEITCPGSGAEDEAEPLLILHGLLGSSRNFQGFAKALSGRLQRPRRIIMPDLRNHGDSPHARSMSYMSMAMDVVALLDQLGIDKSCIIGHSMGGESPRPLFPVAVTRATARAHARARTHTPRTHTYARVCATPCAGKVAAALALYYSDRVESVGILDIAPVDYSKQVGPGAETWKDISVIIKALHEVSDEALADKKLVDAELAKTISDPVLRAFALTNLARDPATGGMRWKIGIANLYRNMGIIGGFDLGQGLQAPASELGLSFPRDAFFVQGGKSRFISSRHLPEIAAMFPRFKLSTIRNCGHWVHSEDPETTISNVQLFLDRPDPTPFEKFLERGL